MSSWAALKEHIAAEAEHGHALAQVRWVFGRYGEADAPGWTAPSRDELSEQVTGHLLTLVPPKAAAAILGGVAPKLREDQSVPTESRAPAADAPGRAACVLPALVSWAVSLSWPGKEDYAR